MDRVLYAAIAAVAIMISLLLVFPQSGSKAPSGLGYAEVALDDPSCPGGECMAEYFIASNGVVFKKTLLEADARLDVRKATPDRAAEIIKTIAEMQQPNTGFVKDAPQYHVYSFVGDFERSYLEKGSSSARDMVGLAEELFSEAPGSEDFFVQFVFWRQGELIQDYHIFEDGLTVLSEFTGEGEMVGSRLFEMGESVIQGIRSRIGAFEGGLPRSCARDGYVYGYLMAYREGRDDYAYTCGMGQTASDEMFNFLLENVP